MGRDLIIEIKQRKVSELNAVANVNLQLHGTWNHPGDVC